MAKKEKLLTKLIDRREMKYRELEVLMLQLGFTKKEFGGSRVRFTRGEILIRFDKPHPQPTVKKYVLDNIRNVLKAEGDI